MYNYTCTCTYMYVQYLLVSLAEEHQSIWKVLHPIFLPVINIFMVYTYIMYIRIYTVYIHVYTCITYTIHTVVLEITIALRTLSKQRTIWSAITCTCTCTSEQLHIYMYMYVRMCDRCTCNVHCIY